MRRKQLRLLQSWRRRSAPHFIYIEKLKTKTKGFSHLSSYVLVGETDNDTVLWRVVLVLILDDKPLPCIIVCTSFPTPLEFDLEPLKVRLVLNNLYESL
jgi:hypothetical protein